MGRAVEAAGAAFPGWARTPFAERQALVERFVEVLKARQEDLAVAIAAETGKPLWEARTEVGAMVGKVALSIKAYHERTGEREKRWVPPGGPAPSAPRGNGRIRPL